jgi:RNAse (barnase) inhibitor barstar
VTAPVGVAPGRYQLVPANAVEQFMDELTGARIVFLNGDRIDDKTSLLEEAAAALELPPWFGRNWDALADVLTDASMRPPMPTVIVHSDAHRLANGQPEDWEMWLDICDEAVDRWKDDPHPMWLVVAGRSLTTDFDLIER